MSIELEKKYKHKDVEERIYKMWEEGGYFTPEIDEDKEPFTIVLPPPNSNGKLHVGHALMVAIEDLLVRWKRMQGYSALWVPGTDHAGFETQLVYEKHLSKEGKSRLDFDRNTLYEQIYSFVREQGDVINDQVRSLGPSLDWSRYTFTLDDHVIETVYSTFEKMADEGLVYRDDYMVNYCPAFGTTFADLEVKHIEQTDPLIYLRYPLVDRKEGEPEHLVVATVRPEPIFVDTHMAVHPEDEERNMWIGRKVLNPLTGEEMDVIGHKFVDPEFGTGIVKLTPAHDKNDYDVARELNLPIVSAINLDGTMNDKAGDLSGLPVLEAREKVIEILKEKDLIEKIDESYTHTISVSYKENKPIEPMIMPNWFVKVDTLKTAAHDAVKNGDVNIYPKWQETKYHRWMEDMKDWPISRQIVWGIRIPAWYDISENPKILVTFLNEKNEIESGLVSDMLEKYDFETIEKGLQSLIAPNDAKFKISNEKPGDNYLQETDTFDTWFSSGHWPLVTLKYPDSDDFKYFYPTAVLETGWEILRFWVSRMIMFGLYLTGKPPFKDVYLHGLVRAEDGRKMSKSLGNQVDPLDAVEEFGADTLRMGLISGTANGKDFNFPKDRVISYRNFCNKIWNMARFMLIMIDKYQEETGETLKFYSEDMNDKLSDEDKAILNGLSNTINSVNDNLEKYRFSEAGETIYHFMWDELASSYIEHVKNRDDKDVALAVLRHVYLDCLKLLHPFMPFITEEIWSKMPKQSEDPIIISKWPEA